MNKTYKKLDIDKYITGLKKEHVVREEEINELVDTAGTMIDKNDNYRATPSIVKSKKTADDFVRSATQGPEAYFIYGGPYYGINYSYIVNEEDNVENEEVIEEDISPEAIQDLEAFHSPNKKAKKYAIKDIKKHFYKPGAPGYDLDPVDKWAKHSLPYDTEFKFDVYSESEMKNMVDEFFIKKKDKERGIVKRTDEQDVLGDITLIPDINELKKTFEKPMVIRKLNHLLDLIGKEQLTGEELAIVLNHLIENVEIHNLSEKHKEILGDKIKYGNEEE